MFGLRGLDCKDTRYGWCIATSVALFSSNVILPPLLLVSPTTIEEPVNLNQGTFTTTFLTKDYEKFER